MKYYIIPTENPTTRAKTVMSVDATPIEKIYKAIKELHRNVTNTLKKMSTEDSALYPTVFYLYDDMSMAHLKSKLKDGDELILHAEGVPFCIGLDQPSSYDLNAYSFAKLIYEKDLLPKDKDITLTLLACNSAVLFTNTKQNVRIHFAQDLSKGLYDLYGYERIKIKGYTGLIVEKKGKYSVAEELDEPKKKNKGAHSSLEDAAEEYLNGQIINSGRKIIRKLSEVNYGDWANKYIEKAKIGNHIIYKIDEALECRNERQRFFRALPNALENDIETEELSEDQEENRVNKPSGGTPG